MGHNRSKTLDWYKEFGIEVIYSDRAYETYTCGTQGAQAITNQSYVFITPVESKWKRLWEQLDKLEKLELIMTNDFLHFYQVGRPNFHMDWFEMARSFYKEEGKGCKILEPNNFIVRLAKIQETYLNRMIQAYLKFLEETDKKLVFQSRLPWSLEHVTQQADSDMYGEVVNFATDHMRFRTRFVFAVLHKNAKLMEDGHNGV